MTPTGIAIYTTCAPSSRIPASDYPTAVAEIARWSEAAGCTGILVYTDHSLLDPWLVGQMIISATRSISPLVAVQPVYTHPYTVAKTVTSLAELYGRQVHLNFVAGGFRRDLLSFHDPLSHDDRYDRLAEYASIVQSLLADPRPLTFSGRYYAVRDLKLTPPLRADLRPVIMVSGSSAAGLEVARALGAIAVRYPERPGSGQIPEERATPTGIRIGIIARADASDAWRVARERFPVDRKGQITHALALQTSDSEWHRQLADAGPDEPEDDPYWLHPFRNYQTFCPYLVGSYERVAEEVRRYLDDGVSTVILDVPRAADDLEHVNVVFALATHAGPPGVAPPSGDRLAPPMRSSSA
jgi:alkanesulfonate monooxygenase